MKKNYKNYGPTGLLWALYLIVGVVAFLVSNFYFKFELKDALIFAGINFVGVILFTEGIDFIFKKVKSRKASADTEDEPTDEPEEEPVAGVAAETETPDDSADETDTAEPAVEATVVAPDKVEDETASEDQPVRRRGLFGRRKPAPVVAAEENTEEAEPKAEAETSEPEEHAAVAVAEDAPVLSPVPDEEPVCFKPGPAAEAVEAQAEEPAEVHAEAPETESATEPVEEQPVRRRGRRANPDAVVDAPTSSIAVITPDMVKPTAEPELVVEPVAEAPVAPEAVVVPEVVASEPVAEEKSLSAEEFLSTTKLTSPRAIVREYQRLGGKEDIFAVLMERQK